MLQSASDNRSLIDEKRSLYSKARKYLHTLENTKPTLLARFPNLAALQSVNLIMGFTIYLKFCKLLRSLKHFKKGF